MLQWGKKEATGTGIGGSWVTVTFPRTFSQVYGVFANRIINTTGADDSYIGYLDYEATNSSFTFRKRAKDDMYWLAIGKL